MSKEASKLRGTTPFPLAGDGVYLQYKAEDLLALQTKFGDSWFLDAQQRLNRFDMAFMMGCMEHGGKKDGKPFKIDVDEIDQPIVETFAIILNALYMSVHGRNFSEYTIWLYERLEKQREVANKAEEDEDPSLQGPAVSSDDSADSLSGQV